MRAPLLLLSLALVGCVTVQPCVCPTAPAPKPECDPILNPEACTVYDAAPKTSITITPAQPVWFDGCNWHTAASPDNIDRRWPFGDNSDTSLRQTTALPYYDVPTTPLVVVTPTRTPTPTAGRPR